MLATIAQAETPTFRLHDLARLVNMPRRSAQRTLAALVDLNAVTVQKPYYNGPLTITVHHPSAWRLSTHLDSATIPQAVLDDATGELLPVVGAEILDAVAAAASAAAAKAPTPSRRSLNPPPPPSSPSLTALLPPAAQVLDATVGIIERELATSATLAGKITAKQLARLVKRDPSLDWEEATVQFVEWVDGPSKSAKKYRNDKATDWYTRLKYHVESLKRGDFRAPGKNGYSQKSPAVGTAVPAGRPAGPAPAPERPVETPAQLYQRYWISATPDQRAAAEAAVVEEMAREGKRAETIDANDLQWRAMRHIYLNLGVP